MDSMSDPFTDLDINCRSQLSILEACRKHNPDIQIVFASTRQVYGKPQYLPVDEKHPLQPVDIMGLISYQANGIIFSIVTCMICIPRYCGSQTLMVPECA